MSPNEIILTVSIVNWNTREDLLCTLRSIYQHPPCVPFEIMVVDNASTDGSIEAVQHEFAQVRLLVNRENVGFGRGHNRAVKESRGKYVLFLNPDTTILNDALQNLVDFAERHPEAGIIGPKLLNPDGSLQYSCRRFPNIAAAMFRNTPLGRLFPQNRYTRDYLLTDWDHNSERAVDWLSGSALLIRREVIEQIGAFDEQFFMYCEDVDLCYRAWQAGWKVLYHPDAVIVHAIGRSSDPVANKMIRVFHASMYRFYRKHYAPKTPFFLRPFILPGLILRASIFILKNEKDALIRALKRRFVRREA